MELWAEAPLHIATALVAMWFEVIGIIWNHLSNAMNHPRISVNLDFLNITFSCFLFGFVFLLFLETSFCIRREKKSPRLILSLLNQNLFSNVCYDSYKGGLVGSIAKCVGPQGIPNNISQDENSTNSRGMLAWCSIVWASEPSFRSSLAAY